MISKVTLDYGEEFARMLLGVDGLVRAQDGDDDDRLIVVNMGPAIQPMPYGTFDDALAHLDDLEARATALAEPDRALYYRQQCGSTRALIARRRGDLALPEQIARFLHVAAEPASDAELEGLRAQIHDLLTQMGYHGDLVAQCSAWQERQRVAPEDVSDVLMAYMDEAWDRTAAIIPLPAPKSDGMRVAIVRGAHFNARCNYLARTVEINIDPVLTRPALKHLAIHEGYPGHYVQFKLREHWYAEGLAPADVLFSIVNSASSCTFEGIADYGTQLLDWIDADDRVQAQLMHYGTGLGTGAAWRLHALGESEEQVADWLRARALIGGEGWIANRLRFIAAPQRCALIWSYWYGEPAVRAAWEQVPAARRDEFLRFVYGRMHSTQSILLFAR
jgi:hypothetical protein